MGSPVDGVIINFILFISDSNFSLILYVGHGEHIQPSIDFNSLLRLLTLCSFSTKVHSKFFQFIFYKRNKF